MVKFCPECGTMTVRRHVAERECESCPACGFVQFARANIGVGALVFRSESVLLVERAFRPYSLWTLPSGYQEEGETLEAAVVRDVWEETKIQVQPRGIVFLRNMMEHDAVDMYAVFLCEPEPDQEPVVNDGESTAAGFILLDELDKLNVEPDSRWFIETYLDLQLEPMLKMKNSFNHPYLQIFAANQ